MTVEKVLLVDDNNGQRLTLESILKRSGFDVVSADCGMAALSAAKENKFAVALLDIKMPDITGIEVLKELKQKTPTMAVIMMTGYAETEYCIDALNAGATAYLLKPANIEQIKSLLNQAIENQRLQEENKAMAQAIRELNAQLEEKVKARTAQVANAHRATLKLYEEIKRNFTSTIEILSLSIDQRDPLTASHSFRVTQYALEIGKVLNQDEKNMEVLRYSGLMHDLGKIEIKESILCKDGSLTSEEYKEIQTHANGTYKLLSKFRFKNHLKEVPKIASSHHERFDGTGYPCGLKGKEIPLLARVLAVADVVDAITSKRHYRSAMSILDALSILKREIGGQFDETCANAFFEIPASNFIQVHMADHLSKLDPVIIMELNSVKMKDIYEICREEKPNKKQLESLQAFYNYYQGPVPSTFEGKVKPAPVFE